MTQKEEAYSDPNLKKNQVAARVAAPQTATAAPSVPAAQTSHLRAAANGTVTSPHPTAPKPNPAIQPTASRAAELAEAMRAGYAATSDTAARTAARISELTQSLQTALRGSKAGATTLLWDAKSQSDIPMTKKARVDAMLKAGLKQSDPARTERGGEEISNSSRDLIVKYGSIIRPMPDESSELYRIITKLPASFPFEEWVKMTSDEQRSAIEKTDLSSTEQWIILNANVPIDTIRQLQEIKANNNIAWSSSHDKKAFLEEVWHIGCAKYELSTHSHQFSYDARSSRILLDMLSIKENKLLEFDGTEILLGDFNGTLLDYSDEAMASYPTPTSPSRKTYNPSYKINKNGELENNTIVILYTSGYKANFTRHSKYHAEMLERKGFRTETHKVNTVDEFKYQWNNIDESVKAVIVLAHSNGNALILKHNTSTEALSVDGKNSNGEKIGDLRDLKGPYIDELYLLSCNTANETLYSYNDTNVTDILRDKPNINKVFGYDGSMGFGEPIKNHLPHASLDPRLSNEQDRYYRIKNKYHKYLEYEEEPAFDDPSGLYLYDSKER